MSLKHLAIFNKPSALAILNGKKTVETRFSTSKIAPFGKVSVGDIVFIKISGGDIVGQFLVKKVFFYEGLTEEDLGRIFTDYKDQISVGDDKLDQEYLKLKKTSKYGTLIFIDQAKTLITSPIRFSKHDLRGWMVLDK